MDLDRISDMPDQIKQHILSLLDMKDAVRTCVLSKRWRHEWNWLPCLKFKHLPYKLIRDGTYLTHVLENLPQDFSSRQKSFLDSLERTLVRRSCVASSNVLEKLILFVPISSVNASRIDLWLACALECKVSKLKLHIQNERNNNKYRLPGTVLVASSITWLKLCNCSIKIEDPSIMKLSPLQKLYLLLVDVDQGTFYRILSNCSAIRKLRILWCSGIKELKLDDAPKLEVLQISCPVGLERIFINALNLQTLSITEYRSQGHFNVAGCKNIRRLSLTNVNITENDLSFHLDLLEDLRLVNCNLLVNLMISAPNLKHLIVRDCHQLDSANINAPKLKSFSYFAYHYHVLPLSMNAPLLESASVTMSCDSRDDQWIVRFTDFLEKLNPDVSMDLFILHDGMKCLFIPEDLRQSRCPPLLNLKCVTVKIARVTIDHQLVELIDSLLWQSPLLETIVVYLVVAFRIVDYIKFQFIYQEPIVNEARHSCCSTSPMQCWKHCLKEVIIENLKSLVVASKLKTLFENAETLERIEGLPI